MENAARCAGSRFGSAHLAGGGYLHETREASAHGSAGFRLGAQTLGLND